MLDERVEGTRMFVYLLEERKKIKEGGKSLGVKRKEMTKERNNLEGIVKVYSSLTKTKKGV